jgi:nitrilase
MLVDPWGEILIQKPESEGVVMGELDLAHLASVRTSLPALQHRRL